MNKVYSIAIFHLMAKGSCTTYHGASFGPGGGYLNRFWSGTCHRSFKNIPVPYTNFAKKYTRPYTNFPKMYTRPYTNFAKMYTRPYTNFAKMYTRPYTNFPKMYTRPYTNFPKMYTRPYTKFPKCIPDLIPIFRKCTPDLILKHPTNCKQQDQFSRNRFPRYLDCNS